MKKFWVMNWMSGFARSDLKGFGRWLLAGILLSILIGRMRIQIIDDTIYVDGGPNVIIYLICFGLYMFVFNLLTNRPQFFGALPYTSKQEVRMVVGLFLGCFLLLILLFAILSALYYFLDFPMDSSFSLHDSAKNILFSFAYYIFVTALLFPLAMIYDKKKWYIIFVGIAVIIAVVSLFFINLMPGDGFRTSGQVFENVSKLPYCNLVLTLMVVLAVGSSIASYLIAQKLHAPKKYT